MTDSTSKKNMAPTGQPTSYADLMDTGEFGALARWQTNLKRYTNQIRADFPTAAATLSLVCTEMEAARKSLRKERGRKRAKGRGKPGGSSTGKPTSTG